MAALNRINGLEGCVLAADLSRISEPKTSQLKLAEQHLKFEFEVFSFKLWIMLKSKEWEANQT